jgi:uncharacterized membrane protein
MERPRLKIELSPTDRLIETLGFIALLALIGLPLYYYNQLPDSIPRHFGLNGEPDAYSGKAIIWTLPAIGLILFSGMYWLNKHPHIFNYPQEITEENAERLYTGATRMMRSLNTTIAFVFAYISFSTIRTALGEQAGLGTWFSPVFISALLLIVGLYLFQSNGKKARQES